MARKEKAHSRRSIENVSHFFYLLARGPSCDLSQRFCVSDKVLVQGGLGDEAMRKKNVIRTMCVF